MHMSAYTTTGVFTGTLLKKGGGFSVGGRRNWKVCVSLGLYPTLLSCIGLCTIDLTGAQGVP
jgi:hypothetical protein